jgi:hypothetical protein
LALLLGVNFKEYPMSSVRSLWSWRSVVITLLAGFVSACGSSGSSVDTPPVTPPSIAPDLATGMASLQTVMTTQATDDFLTAATAFDRAAQLAAADTNATEGQRNQAYFFGAAARLALLANPYSNVWPAGMDRLGDVLDAYGLGGTPAQRSRFQTIQFRDCTSGKCVFRVSSSSPRTAAIQGFMSDKVASELQEAAARLGRVTQSFQATVTNGRQRVWFDYTDARFLKGVAEAAIAAIRIQQAYHLDIDVYGTQNTPSWTADSFMVANPTLLTLGSPTGLPVARAQAMAAVQSFKQALAALKAETGDQTDHFIKLTRSVCGFGSGYYSCQTVFNPADQVADIETWLNEMGAALAASGQHTLAVKTVIATFVPDAFFAGVDFRSKLPASLYAGASMPDPSMGGVLVSPTLLTWPSFSRFYIPFGIPWRSPPELSSSGSQ